MEYLRGYRVLRDDPRWGSKLFTASVLMLSAAFIPIVGQLVMTGFQALILRRAVHGTTSPMPRLDFDFGYMGKLLAVGFKGFIVRFLWSLPLVVVLGGLFGCVYLGAILIAIAASRPYGEDMVPIIIGSVSVAGMLLLVPLGALLMIPANVAAMRAELTDDLDQGLRVSEVLAFSRRHLGPLFKGALALGFANLVLMLLGLLACYVGAFVAVALGMIAQAHFMAQVYQRHVEAGGEALPIAPDDLEAAGAPPRLLPAAAGSPAPPQTGGWPSP